MDARIANLAIRFDAIEAGIKALQQSLCSATTVDALSKLSPELDPCSQDTPEVAQLRALCRTLPLHTAVFRWVPSEYYQRPLQWRRDILQAPSIQYLCKSIVLENTHCVNTDCSVRENSRFYIVLFQYVEKFDSEKLMRFVKDLNPSLGKKKFNFRLADPEVSQKMTGFGYNAVVPFGGNVDIPVILSEKLTHLSPSYFWMGGGHVDCKLRIDLAEFLRVIQPFVADIANPLSEEELNCITD